MKLLVFFFLIQNVFAEIKGNPQFNTFLKNNGLDKEEQHLAGGCQIYNLNGQLIRSYLGSHCFFEDDGSYLVSHHDSGALELRDKKNKIKWKLPNILAHHQISKNSDNNYLVMSSKVVTYQKALIRFDVFNIISPIDGKILTSFDTSKFVLEYFKETPLPLDSMWPVEPEIMGSKLEATHANTFFQISGLAKPTPNMNNGDYIITVIGPNRSVAILESKTLNVKKMYAPTPILIHDAQVLPDGRIIYFNNIIGSELIAETLIDKVINWPESRSTIEIFNPETPEKVTQLFDKKSSKFYMPVAGSLQLFQDGSMLTNDSLGQISKFHFIDKNQKTIAVISTGIKNKIAIPYIRLRSLTKFLKHNIGH